MTKYVGTVIFSMMFVWCTGMMYQAFGFDTISQRHHAFGVVAIKKEKITGALYIFDCSPVAKGCIVTKL